MYSVYYTYATCYIVNFKQIRDKLNKTITIIVTNKIEFGDNSPMTQTNLILRNNLNEHVLSFPIPYFFHSNNFSRSSTRHIYSFLVILKHFSLGLLVFFAKS